MAPLLGMVGPLVVWPAVVVHVALPVTATRHLLGDGRRRFAVEDAPRIAEGLEWLLGVYGWAALLATRAPWTSGPPGIRLRVSPPPGPPPRPGRAALRLVTGLPAALGQLVLGVVALAPWLLLVASVLVAGRAPAALWRVQAWILSRHARSLCRQAAISGPDAPVLVWPSAPGGRVGGCA